MPAAKTGYEHIVIADNVPIVAGTTMKVVEPALDKLAYGWSPEELRLNHPCLTMGQIHAAPAYYWDHADEIEQDIERRLQRVNTLRSETQPAPLLQKLKAKGRL